METQKNYVARFALLKKIFKQVRHVQFREASRLRCNYLLEDEMISKAATRETLVSRIGPNNISNEIRSQIGMRINDEITRCASLQCRDLMLYGLASPRLASHKTLMRYALRFLRPETVDREFHVLLSQG
jgi:hypothetical protein